MVRERGKGIAAATLVCCGIGAANLASAVVIDHTAIAGVSSYSQAAMDEIGTQRWLFTHASVGSNMIDGMNTLHGENASFYELDTVGWGTKGTYGDANYSAANAPTTTAAGTIYEVARGNPSWQNKIACFENSLKPVSGGGGGWGTKVDYALNKFCWIDPYADATTYLNSMSGLEALYTDVRIVYSTIPLTGESGGENDLRNAFNDAVRAFCTGNSRLLYDIADMQAWSTDGVEQTYVSNGNTYQKMWLGYAVSNGDWHLNDAGRRQIAMGWYATAAAPVPEPATCVVLGAMVLGMTARKRRKNKS
jgi:hypothetical protein